MLNHDPIKKWTKAIGLMLIMALAGTSSYGQEKRVVRQLNVLGTAVVYQKNLVDGRQNAVNDALVAAVGQVVVDMLTGETVVRRFKLINDRVLAQQDKYVQNYRVLTESVSGNSIRVLVQVEIAADRVSRDLSRLGVALAGAVYPSILFMVAEKNVNDADFSYWWGDRRLHGRTIGEGAMAQTFGSCCHGAGRLLSRTQATKKAKGRSIGNELEAKGIFVLSRGKRTLKEEMSEAYKDISQVIEAVHGPGLAYKVARLRPLGVIKG